MRCHFIWDEESKSKILIPGCMSAAVFGDIFHCSCPIKIKSFKEFEKDEYNKVVKELREENEILIKQHNNHLRIISKLTKK